MDVETLRGDFPALDQKVNGHPLIYLDNAATTQKPMAVIEAITRFYYEDNANVHRAIYQLGERATKAYENARAKVAAFIGAPERSLIFTRGATEAINLVAYAWGRHELGPGDEIVVTALEHHSNLVPWQLLARDTGATLRHIPLTDDNLLDLEAAGEVIGDRTRLVALAHKSNVFGVVNPVAEVTRLARSAGALVLLDAAQSVPHLKVDVQALDCDFLAFSGHKMLGPTGVGGLYGKPDLLEAMEPFMAGGEMIGSVNLTGATWNEIPWKFEAGTPNIAQAVGLGAAVDYLEAIGMDRVTAYLEQLSNYAREALTAVPGLTLYTPNEGSAVFAFNVDGIHPHDLAQLLDQEGIAVRAGHHCAQPAIEHLKVAATARASLYIYNTFAEIDGLAAGLEQARKFMTG
ncbi:MAG: cysteine desulfurase [Candidatus Neomarinimicrobiota bacterium]